jgi:hypothetical protein
MFVAPSSRRPDLALSKVEENVPPGQSRDDHLTGD